MYYIYHLCLLFDFSLRINYLLMLRRICESRYASSLAFKRPLDKQSNALERSTIIKTLSNFVLNQNYKAVLCIVGSSKPALIF